MPDLTRAGLGLRLPPRQRISFRAVNCRAAPDYDPGLQRHHILPRQVLTKPCFHPMLSAIGRDDNACGHNGTMSMLPSDGCTMGPLADSE